MAWYPGAIKRPVSGHTNGRMRSYRGVVLHCNDANSASLYGWITGNPNGMSCHFQVFLDGTIEQYLDTAVSSWCQGGGNDDWLSLETSGRAGDKLTDKQIAAIGPLLKWLADTHGFPLQLADSPSGRGLGWHGMAAAVGDTSWGHAVCPGVRKDQRSTLLALAAGHSTSGGSVAPIEDEDDELNDHQNQVIEEILTRVQLLTKLNTPGVDGLAPVSAAVAGAQVETIDGPQPLGVVVKELQSNSRAAVALVAGGRVDPAAVAAALAPLIVEHLPAGADPDAVAKAVLDGLAARVAA